MIKISNDMAQRFIECIDELSELRNIIAINETPTTESLIEICTRCYLELSSHIEYVFNLSSGVDSERLLLHKIENLMQFTKEHVQYLLERHLSPQYIFDSTVWPMYRILLQLVPNSRGDMLLRARIVYWVVHDILHGTAEQLEEMMAEAIKMED